MTFLWRDLIVPMWKVEWNTPLLLPRWVYTQRGDAILKTAVASSCYRVKLIVLFQHFFPKLHKRPRIVQIVTMRMKKGEKKFHRILVVAYVINTYQWEGERYHSILPREKMIPVVVWKPSSVVWQKPENFACSRDCNRLCTRSNYHTFYMSVQNQLTYGKPLVLEDV